VQALAVNASQALAPPSSPSRMLHCRFPKDQENIRGASRFLPRQVIVFILLFSCQGIAEVLTDFPVRETRNSLTELI
jgi:hypothetical protein